MLYLGTFVFAIGLYRYCRLLSIIGTSQAVYFECAPTRTAWLLLYVISLCLCLVALFGFLYAACSVCVFLVFDFDCALKVVFYFRVVFFLL